MIPVARSDGHRQVDSPPRGVTFGDSGRGARFGTSFFAPWPNPPVRTGLSRRLRTALSSLRRVEQRSLSDLRDWLENTRNLLHLSVLLVLPILLAVVTYVSNAVDLLPFLLFPPLASGAHTLFSRPESRYASPRRFVGGLTTGAFCGWVALELTARFWYRVPPEAFQVNPGAAALGIFLTGALTWALDIEESSAFSTALLVLVTGVTRPIYVVSVAVSTTIIAGIFLLWRRHVYEQRAHYLYRSTKASDQVLVPMRGPDADATAMLAARLAGAHEAGKVVLLDVVQDEEIAEVERAMLSGDAEALGAEATERGERPRDVAEERLGEETVHDLERRADRIEAAVPIPCEIIVAADRGDHASTVIAAAREANCDLIVVPYGGPDEAHHQFVRGLLGSDVDVVLHQSYDGRTDWERVLVPVRRAGNVAHAMIDFALRLAEAGHVSVCRCIDDERERRQAEEALANLVETERAGLETRVARSDLKSYLQRTAADYDLVIVGASTDRSRASRFVTPPTFRSLEDVECDVAVVDRA